MSFTKDGYHYSEASRMSGQRLMCVWQAVYAQDTKVNNVAKAQIVREVTSSFTRNNLVKFSNSEFDDVFPGETVDFDKYVQFVRKSIIPNDEASHAVLDSIETMSWEMSKPLYNLHRVNLDEEDSRKMWEIYNRLCEPGTVPPKMEQDDANWIGEKISAQLTQHWTASNVPHTMCFGELLLVIDDKCFSKASRAAASKAIDDLHSWLVREVAMTGWLYKRTRKQANWTSWLKRWFVLTPGKMVYYDSVRQKEMKGEVVVNSHSKIEELSEFKSLTRRFTARFRVTNSPYLELELSAADNHERKAWVDALDEIITAASKGTTPVQHILKERQTQKKKGSRMTVDQATSKLKSYRLKSIHVSKAAAEAPKPKKAPIPQKLPVGEGTGLSKQMARIQEVFNKVDKDNNGAIDQVEFSAFIKDLGLRVSDEEIEDIFSSIEESKDGIITIDEFSKYFIDTILSEDAESSSKAEARLRSAFMHADRSGDGTVDFREFTEYLWEKRRSMRLSKIMKAFDDMGKGENEINFDQFKNFFNNQRSSLAAITEEDEEDEDGDTLEKQLRHMYDEAEVQRLASFLRQRWTAFASFKREGQSGELVMRGGHGMVADVMPGNYNLVDLACFSDLPPVKPRHIEIQNVRWIDGVVGGHGKALFPPDFDGVLPIEVATTEHLRYYGASLADTTQVKVSLMYRHGIQDFTYENQYLDDYVKSTNGGAGIEHHDFSHLDCPLEDDSGHFVMGKFEDGVLHLTGFKVPTRHTLYIPGGVIHSNDYLKGTWRTMLSDEADINHVHIMRRRRKGNDDLADHFTFTFK